MSTIKEYTVEVFHQGEPVHLVDLNAFDEDEACRRARNAIFMAALKDGREFKLDDLSADIYEGVEA